MIPSPALAQIKTVFPQCNGTSAANSAVCQGSGANLFGPKGVWTTVLNVLTFIGGAMAVIVIIISGLRYITSGGDPAAVKSAKNAIVYAAMGLVVAISSSVVINFVLANIKV
ncbi:MAG TPA: hypothetical protein VNG90_01835 [Candidatus Acidoferrum sp.]|nr:hypothetical protein [Candidatus Acidoferrum sp.]